MNIDEEVLTGLCYALITLGVFFGVILFPTKFILILLLIICVCCLCNEFRRLLKIYKEVV